jgi:hypothetical protein
MTYDDMYIKNINFKYNMPRATRAPRVKRRKRTTTSAAQKRAQDLFTERRKRVAVLERQGISSKHAWAQVKS